MSALPGTHLCLKHQGNHSHYAKGNCVICVLTEALKAAKHHLDYCAYGDRWEKEVAQAAKLEETIEAALRKAAQ